MEQIAQITPHKRRGRPPVSDAERKKPISVAFEPELIDLLARMSEQTGASQSEIMRDALRHYVAHWGSDKSGE